MQLHDQRGNNELYRQALEMFRKPLVYFKKTKLGRMIPFVPEDGPIYALNFFHMISDGNPYSITGKIKIDNKFYGGEEIKIANCEQIDTQNLVGELIEFDFYYEDERFNGSLRTERRGYYPSLLNREKLINFYCYYSFPGENALDLKLNLTPKKHLDYTPEHLQDLKRIKTNLKRYKL